MTGFPYADHVLPLLRCVPWPLRWFVRLSPFWGLVFGMGLVAAAWAEEPFGVSLLRPDSLAGWEYGDPPPAGWTIQNGRLSASKNATPLLSGFSFGDFELRFQWSVSGGGAWKVLLPEVPAGKGLTLVLREGAGCGQLEDGERIVAQGLPIEPLAHQMHTAVLRRSEGKLALKVDHRELYQIDVAPARRFGLGLAVSEGDAALADLRVHEPPGTPIFNGKDLTGWWTPGNHSAWTAENGAIVLSQHGGNYLRTEKEYANFTLSLEYKAAKGTNSGIGIRTPRPAWPSGDGMELQIWDLPYDHPLDKHQTMAIYGNVPPLARADRSEQWNRVVVKADGWMISAWVNGELVQQINTLHHPELKHRNLTGWIGVQDHGSRIEFRNVCVLEAPPGTGLAAWLRPAPKRASTALLDRLMNPERLSVADGITAAVAAKHVAADPPAEHVLAELTGPGAIVRIARSNNQGRLAFYFDGEAEPRIECKPEDLPHALPALSEDPEPVLTLLGFAKSLKVTLREATAAEYRFDCVTFPADLPVDTFSGPEAGFPRGWLSAIHYRHSQAEWGVHREYDPLPRFHSDTRTIEPGKCEQLIHLDGAGIVQWLKLRASKQVLDNNDLWLEVTIDGEPSPAVAAPARFWFPGLAGQGNFHNFVMLDRGGVTTRLAMPYGDGMTICARNAGARPIRDVGVTLSYEPATDQTRPEITGRMRLRGLFQPAEENASELVRQAGNARWVALVYQQPEGQPAAIDAFVDDKPLDGWSAVRFDMLLGGKAGDFRSCLSGRRGGLAWCYFLLAPVDFQKSLVLKAPPGKLGDRLALFYIKK